MLASTAAAAAAAAAATANPSLFSSCSSSSSFHLRQRQNQKPKSPPLSLCSPSTTFKSFTNCPNSRTQLGLDLGFRGARGLVSCWSGLKQLTISSPSFPPHSGKRMKFRGKVVYASLFGVGAPEALVIGVVALLVFGPKGLAEVARNLGKTLRAFQPTIRELQDVSREFKSTLEREIGLDDVTSSTNNTSNSFPNENQQARVDPNGAPKAVAYTSEDLLKITQEQLAASATAPQSQVSSPSQDQQQAVSTSNVVADAPTKVTTSSSPDVAAQIPPLEKPEKES